ncbi:MAG: hypothetical protein KKE11_03645 [Gammaproteobacteria bacterium]|nr:hypothetical protein [Gammaproteobacteria bacterium]
MKWSLKILSHKENEQAAQELKILEEDIIAARNFLRSNRKSYFQGKKKIPVHLILGPSRFGKSTILSQAGLDLIDIDHQTMGDVTPTKYCSFWFTKDGLYIDTAGNYTKPDINKPRNDLIWQGFIKLLQKYFGKDSIAATLIVLDLPAIAQDKLLLKKSLFCICERIYEMSSLIKTLYLHIIFTKCDRILGFTEFFSMLDSQERLQPFGISFANDKKSDLIPAFEAKFNQLLKHLNNRVIENLQKTLRPQERSLIKIFPSQIDHLRQTFIDVISKIPHSHQILLSGMYFTSSIQEGTAIDPIKASLFQALNLKEKPTYNLEAGNDRSYFVEDIFKKTLSLPKQQRRPKFNRKWTKIEYVYALLLALLIVGTSSIIGYQSYHKNIIAITQTKLSLAKQNIVEPNGLYETINQLEQNSISPWLTLGINKTKELYLYLTKTHQTMFIQNLSLQLEGYLNTANNDKEPIDEQNLYHGLQVYLMFSDYNKLDPSYVKSWFDNYWLETSVDAKQKTNMQQQLTSTLRYKFKIVPNQSLITSIRDTLNNLPSVQLIYLLLESDYANKNLDLGFIAPISDMYLSENFHKIYNTIIPNIVKTLPKYNWVLGDLNLNEKISSDTNTIKQIQNLYLEKYALAWANALKPATKIEFENPTKAAEYLNTISTKNSPLLDLLKQIKVNCKVNNAPKKLTKEIDSKLPGVNVINLAELQSKLNKLTSYIETIAKNDDPNQAAFAAIARSLQEKSTNDPLASFKTFANSQPKWLQNYLQDIASSIIQTLIDAAHEHINQAWDQTIMPKYNSTLANKYPLFKDSKDEIKLNDFNQFFSPKGSMDTFFNQYLKPFVNTNKNDWSWKNINDQRIDFSSAYLEVFLRAALIQKMFYPSKSSNPKLEFTLTSKEMSPNTMSFNLNIDGQKITFTKEDSKTQDLIWPGPQPGIVTMSFVNNQGRYFNASEFGPWAWFRILDKANVTSSNNTKHFELTFDLNGNAVKYILSTPEIINPFIPEVINNFRCKHTSLDDEKR